MALTGPTARFGSDAARALLERHSLDSLDRLFDAALAAGVERFGSSHAGRQVIRLTLPDVDAAANAGGADAGSVGHGGGRPARIFVKLQEGRRRLWPRMNDLRSGQVFQSLAEREWRGIETLERLGIAAPERLGLFESPRWSLWLRAAVVVRAVRPPHSVDELLSSGDWNRLPTSDQNSILDAVAQTLQRIHAGGLGWRGSSSRHFFPERGSDGGWRVWLIDCEGIHRDPGSRMAGSNAAKLVRAFRESGADEGTIERLEWRLRTARLNRRAA